MRTFFVPAHITGFFEIVENQDPLKTGSKGGGIVLDCGVNTGAIVEESDANSIKVFYDGKECRCRTSMTAAEEMIKVTCGAYKVEVHHFPKLPMSYGFGVSGSGALGTTLALNHALELDLDTVELGQIAHLAEIRNSTGLGDVAAELSRGLVIRSKEGAPGRGRLKSLPLEGWIVTFLVGRPLRTKSVLKNEEKRIIINAVGRECVKSILKEPTPTRFMELSRKFTFETDIVQKNVAEGIKRLERHGVKSAMSMLGNAIFTITDEPDEVAKLLDYQSIIAKPLDKGYS